MLTFSPLSVGFLIPSKNNRFVRQCSSFPKAYEILSLFCIAGVSHSQEIDIAAA